MSELTTTHTAEGMGAAGSQAHAPEELVELFLPRDLAVQLVGSDAGKARRMRPHGSMTQGAIPQEVAAVERFMKPFLEQEIDRVQNKRTGRPPSHHAGKATIEQAVALKAYCVRFAENAKQHLLNKGDDDRHHRTKQRLVQTRAVIRQINAALGLPADDGRPVAEYIQEALDLASRLRDQLCDLRSLSRAQNGMSSGRETASPPAPELIAFLSPLDALLERIEATAKQ